MAAVLLAATVLGCSVGVLSLPPAATAAAAAFAFPPDPAIPARLLANAARQPLRAGFIDPLEPPYSARGDGRTDDTVALQAALNDSFVARMPVVLRGGRTFLVSSQLECIEHGLVKPTRHNGYQLLGTTEGGRRPVLRLADGSAALVGRPLVYFELFNHGAPDPPSSYASQFRGIDVDMGNNPNATALSMSGAQLCSIEDVHVYGAAFWAGIDGLPGSGGYTANVQVTGGLYGVVQNQFRPNPLIVGLQLVGQTGAGLLVANARGPVVVSGFNITTLACPAVSLQNQGPGGDGSVALEDGLLTVLATGHRGAGNSDAAPAVHGAGTATAQGSPDVTLRNVYIQATTVARLATGDGRPDVVVPAVAGGLATSIPLFSFSSNGSDAFVATGAAPSAASSVPLDDGAAGGKIVSLFPLGPAAAAGSLPGPSLVRQHSWVPGLLPSLGAAADGYTGAWLDVAKTYGATPQWVNDTDDDGIAIQRALLDATTPGSGVFGRPVFIPHGTFHLTDTLTVPCGAALVGAGKHAAVLHMHPTRWSAGARHPLLRTDGGATAAACNTTVVSDVALYVLPMPARVAEFRAPDTLVRDFATEANGTGPPAASFEMDQPFVSFVGPAVSGKFYGLSLDHMPSVPLKECGQQPPAGPGLALLACNGTRGRVDLYQPSTEHLAHDPQVLFTNCSDLHLHAWKFEATLNDHFKTCGRSGSLAWIQACDTLSVFGGSGNYPLWHDAAVIVVDHEEPCGGRGGGRGEDGSSNLTVAALARRGQPNEEASPLWLLDQAAGASLTGEADLLLFLTGSGGGAGV